ncbi:MAG: hypothetical protein MO852_07620 [Candidatus Devosia euplotis]|nr:hypothetical protein [Candidatus Devosia euplotis]
MLNTWCALFMASSDHHYWRARQEAPLPMIASAILFGLISLSFLACAVMLLVEGNLRLVAPPDNWAEQFNSIIRRGARPQDSIARLGGEKFCVILQTRPWTKSAPLPSASAPNLSNTRLA